MWKRYFTVTERCPAKLILPNNQVIDFRSDKADANVLFDLWSNDSPYLKITDEGRKKFMGLPPEARKTRVKKQNAKTIKAAN